MKIGIPTEQPELDAPVCERFGRAPWLLLVDDADGVTAVENGVHLDAVQGAGIQTAQALLAAGAGMVLARHVGPKAHRVLSAGGAAIHLVPSGTGREALAAWRAGRTQACAAADVEGHW